MVEGCFFSKNVVKFVHDQSQCFRPMFDDFSHFHIDGEAVQDPSTYEATKKSLGDSKAGST